MDYIQFNICHLESFVEYLISVKCKPVHKGIWSRPVRTSVLTRKSVPGGPPSTYNGGYSWRRKTSNPTTNLTVFWKPLKPPVWNGQTIQYNIQINSSEGIITPKAGGRFFATFEVDRSTKYLAIIWSTNEIGPSPDTRIIAIPAYKDVTFLTDIVAYNGNNSQLQLFWKHSGDDHIQSYRVFWCEQVLWEICRRTPNTIEIIPSSSLDNTTVPGLFEESSVYLFGVSYTTANNMTTGFIWSDCYVDFRMEEFPVKLDVTLHPNKDGVLVQWRMTKCNFDKMKEITGSYIVQICDKNDCKDYTERKVHWTTNETFIETSKANFCVRVIPAWRSTTTKSATITCTDILKYNSVIVSIMLAVGAVFSFLAIFGICMIVNKIKRTAKRIKKPFVIETPVIFNAAVPPRGDSGLPLLDT